MFSCFNLRFFSGSVEQVVRLVDIWIKTAQHHYICVTGVHGVVASSQDRRVLSAHLNSGLTVPDGMPLVWIGRLLGRRETQRIYGPDLMLSLCALASTRGYRLFLYGGRPQTLARLKQTLTRRFANTKIVGVWSPPFRELTRREEARGRKLINQSRAQLVLVGLSTPKQELWMQRNSSHLDARVLIGVGAAFDFVAGSLPQAPAWLRPLGLEWLFRLVQEPRRLWKRYLVNNTLFLLLVIKSWWRRRILSRQDVAL